MVTCTAYNREHLRGLVPDVTPDRIQLVHHGVSVRTPDHPASSAPAPSQPRADAPPAAPLILAAGRLVAKKGFDTLIDACAELHRRGVAVEYMLKEDEGHGFRNEENEIDFYRAAERFLGEHLTERRSASLASI